MPPKRQSLAAGEGNVLIASNRKARHDFEILEVVEAGIQLTGAEVKSMRTGGQVQLRDGYARVDGGELWLFSVHVTPYAMASGFGTAEPDRRRKLLVHRREVAELGSQVAQGGLTLVPLAMYWKDGKAKVELALARGRKTYDKRHAIAKRDAERDEDRARAARPRGQDWGSDRRGTRRAD